MQWLWECELHFLTLSTWSYVLALFCCHMTGWSVTLYKQPSIFCPTYLTQGCWEPRAYSRVSGAQGGEYTHSYTLQTISLQQMSLDREETGLPGEADVHRNQSPHRRGARQTCLQLSRHAFPPYSLFMFRLCRKRRTISWSTLDTISSSFWCPFFRSSSVLLRASSSAWERSISSFILQRSLSLTADTRDARIVSSPMVASRLGPGSCKQVHFASCHSWRLDSMPKKKNKPKRVRSDFIQLTSSSGGSILWCSRCGWVSRCSSRVRITLKTSNRDIKK